MNTAVLMFHCCPLRLVLLPVLWQFLHFSHTGCSLSWLNSLNQHKTTVSEKKKRKHSFWANKLNHLNIRARRKECVGQPGLGGQNVKWNVKWEKEKRWDSHSWHRWIVRWTEVSSLQTGTLKMSMRECSELKEGSHTSSLSMLYSNPASAQKASEWHLFTGTPATQSECVHFTCRDTVSLTSFPEVFYSPKITVLIVWDILILTTVMIFTKTHIKNSMWKIGTSYAISLG